MQKGNQKTVHKQCKKVIRRRLKDIAKGQSEGGGQTMQKGNQKKVDRQCKKVIRRRWTDNAKR